MQGAARRDLLQDLYVQDLVLSLYAVYAKRVRDEAGRRLIDRYLSAEGDRRRRIERILEARAAPVSAATRSLFRAAGGAYGRLTSLLGTRVMLRITLSASRRASRRACTLLGERNDPDLLYLATVRARNEADLRDDLQQHLIDTRPRRS